MIIYKHRANHLEDPLKYKYLEVDIKYNYHTYGLITGHDISEEICNFSEYLDNCNKHTQLAINVKQTGLLEILNNPVYKSKLNKLKSYFFFDMSIPDLLDYIKIFPNNTACRMSEYELRLYDECKWIWLDFFNSEFDYCMYNTILKFKKNIIVVSPELHKNNNILDIKKLKYCYGICSDIIYNL
jgi:hypothetical protein